ncbi:ABC transporter substrate-binding protein [Candidatus Izemoplasma sp. B36]|uniref:taurine ABC transporter substrate-binding protein n=1 Tax=Candidatus Izemoplasma sp. B36 TaxID=3242468 RepID=UPI0035588F27
MKKLSITILLILLVFLTGCQNKKEVNIGLLMVPNDAILAKQMGLFEEKFGEEGYRVNYYVFDSGTKANIALNADGVDFATMGNINGLASLANNSNTEMVWIHETLGAVEALAVRTSANINSVEDLSGMTIATPFSSTAHYILLNVLKNAGIENDVTITNMTTSQIITAWEAETLDAAYTWQPSLGTLIDNGGEVLISSEDMALLGYKTANIELARKTFAEEHPELVEIYIECMQEANEYFNTDRNAAINDLAEALDLTFEAVELQVNGSIWITLSDMQNADFVAEYVDTMYDQTIFMLEQDLCDRVITREEVAVFINNSYALDVSDNENTLKD